MNSLRARISAVLIISILCVVCVATTTTFVILRGAVEENIVRPLIKQLDLLAQLAAQTPEATSSSGLLLSSPMDGEPREAITDLIQLGFAAIGVRHEVIVTSRPGEQSFASIEVAPGRWLAVPVPELSPPGKWLIVSGWMIVILIGAVVISLLVAQRLTRPLVLLEAFAASIGPNGELQPVPEKGPLEVRAMARALNRLSNKLRQAVESRMRLVASAGHDLRTPLTRMRLRAEFLDEDERGKWLQNLDELERIADSAILLVREEIGGRERETIRLDHLVRSVASELESIGLPVAILGLTPVSIVGPPLATTRALRNLIVNAASHGGGAELTVQQREERAILLIDDHGPGIPDQLLDRVFEPFFRVDQSRRQVVPGAGLGLAISHEILGRFGGELTLRNRPEGGLRQRVTFLKAA